MMSDRPYDKLNEMFRMKGGRKTICR